jgi:hypothetical protein
MPLRCALGPERLAGAKTRRLTQAFLEAHAAALEGLDVRIGGLTCSACYARASEGRLQAHWQQYVAAQKARAAHSAAPAAPAALAAPAAAAAVHPLVAASLQLAGAASPSIAPAAAAAGQVATPMTRKRSAPSEPASLPAALLSAVGPLPAAASILLLYDLEDDPILVRVEESDTLLLRAPHRLLTCNAQLLAPLLREADATGSSAAYADKGCSPVSAVRSELTSWAVFLLALRCVCPERDVGESSFLLLHVLATLHERATQLAPRSTLVVCMLPMQALQAHLRGELCDQAAAADSAASTSHPLQLQLSAEAASLPANVRLRWCTSWVDATRGAPVRAVYLPSLLMLHALGQARYEQTKQRVEELLASLPAPLYPPMAWDELLEHKDRVYAHFHAVMLPTRWIAVSGNAARLAADLLHGQADGEYFVKGSYSMASLCTRRIRIRNGRCAELTGVLRSFLGSQHQSCVGIQAAVAGFDQFELRTWLTVDDSTGRWRPGIVIKTSMEESTGLVTAEQFQPLHGYALRIAALVDRMLTDYAAFFEHMRQLGIPALRIDCGYDSATQRAFFSEFARGGHATMWSQVHGQDLAYVIGRALGQSLWQVAAPWNELRAPEQTWPEHAFAVQPSAISPDAGERALAHLQRYHLDSQDKAREPQVLSGHSLMYALVPKGTPLPAAESTRHFFSCKFLCQLAQREKDSEHAKELTNARSWRKEKSVRLKKR